MPESDKELSGRELDFAIAERVMGWRTSTISVNVWHSEVEHNSFHKEKFRPSESIEAAMQVVEKLRDKKNDRYCEVTNIDGPWEAIFWQGATPLGKGQSDSLPEAICRAALAAFSAPPHTSQPDPDIAQE